MSQTLFEFANFRITYYFLVYLLGFLLVLFVLIKSRKKIGMEKEEIYNLTFIGTLGILIGARLFHVLFWDLGYYLQNPFKIFYLWEGGFSFHGGLVGGLLVLFLYTKNKKVNIWKILDIIVIPVVLVLAFGRIANFINAEVLGKITSIKWCVKFKGIEGCRHPIQLYAAFGKFVLLGFLIWLKNLKLKDGFLFWNFIFWLGLGRFVLDFLKEGELFFGLLVGQWLSLIIIIISTLALRKFKKSPLESSYS